MVTRYNAEVLEFISKMDELNSSDLYYISEEVGHMAEELEEKENEGDEE